MSRKLSTPAAVLLPASLVAASVLCVGVGAAHATTNAVSFLTPGTFSWTAPADATAAVVTVIGGSGGNELNGPAGGDGGMASAAVPLTPGGTYSIIVGGQGGSVTARFLPGLGGIGGGGDGGSGAAGNSGEPAGAGGGGGSSLTDPAGTQLVVAGGGGGAGWSYPGGDGGGTTGGQVPTGDAGLLNGGGGTQTAPGAAGVHSSADGTPPEYGSAGAAGQGGAGESHFLAGGGGGGGGWQGGGGGAFEFSGGGGSGHVASGMTQVATTAGVRNGNGSVIITYGPVVLPSWTMPIVPHLTAGTAFSFGFMVSAWPPADYSISSGTLPTGMNLGVDGALAGTPSSSGSFPVVIRAANPGGYADLLRVLTVDPAPAAPTLLASTPPAAGVGEPFAYRFVASGYPAPVLSVVTGTLPAGLSLSSGGIVSGTPTTAGSYLLSILAENSVGSVQASVTMTVRAKPTLSIVGRSILEGNSGTRPLAFTIRLSRASTVPITVHWGTAKGTAKAGSDFIAASGKITFAPGATSKTISVRVKGDRVKEKNEVFYVVLSAPVNATVAVAKAAGTIRNDD